MDLARLQSLKMPMSKLDANRYKFSSSESAEESSLIMKNNVVIGWKRVNELPKSMPSFSALCQLASGVAKAYQTRFENRKFG